MHHYLYSLNWAVAVRVLQTEKVLGAKHAPPFEMAGLRRDESGGFSQLVVYSTLEEYHLVHRYHRPAINRIYSWFRYRSACAISIAFVADNLQKQWSKTRVVHLTSLALYFNLWYWSILGAMLSCFARFRVFGWLSGYCSTAKWRFQI